MANPGAAWSVASATQRSFGRHQVIRRIAAGGMAEVFLARSEGRDDFEKLVALKTMLPAYADDAELVEMFLDEARLQARLRHPNIVTAFDLDREAGVPFFTMEFVAGWDLRTLLERAAARGEPVPLEVAVGVAVAVAAGLHHAHELADGEGRPLGVVHRDLSPGNVLVGREGDVKLIDFGVAKALSHRARTRAGLIKGKAAYMSPEQCRGETVDRRSDVFALGLLLFELLTGRRAFDDDNEYALIRRIAEEEAPDVAAVAPRLPPAMAAIVRRALSHDPGRRYPTAQALQIDLEDAARTSKLVVSPVEIARWAAELAPPGEAAGEEADRIGAPTRRRRRARWIALGGGAAFLAAAGAFLVVGGTAAPPEAGVDAPSPRCPDDGRHFLWEATRRCYSRHDTPLPWAEARRICRAQDGYLVSYTSGHERMALQDALLSAEPARSASLWIGLHRAQIESQAGAQMSFVWDSEEEPPPTFSLTWVAGEPAAGGGDCVAHVRGDGPLTLAPCEQPKPFLCEVAGWVIRQANGHAYHLFLERATWDEAVAACRRRGAHLVSVEDEAEETFIEAHFPGRRWLGATDRAREGDWRWSDGRQVTYRDFAPLEPDESNQGDDCLALDVDRRWHDRPCDFKYAHICEKE